MIPVLRPVFSESERLEIHTELEKILDSGWIGQGPKVKELEEKWAGYTGAKYAVATNSCTAALDIAVRALWLPEIITVSSFTFISSALAPWNYKHRKNVRFVDIDEETLCTKDAHIQVCYAGNIVESSKAEIYDMAHCAGAKHMGKISCWSFHAVKNLPAGDGGMLTTNDEEVYKRARALSWCGIDKSTFERNKGRYSWDYDIQAPGLKAHMNDITAIIALAKLKNLDADNAYRKQVAEWYDHHLPDFIKRPYRSSTWHLYTIRVPERDRLYDFLAENEISCGVHYKPLYKYPFFKGCALPVTEKVANEIISLPIHLQVTEEDVKRICKLIASFYE